MENHKIYLVKCNNFHKIGITSKQVESRLQSLQTSNPEPITLVHSIHNFTKKQSLEYENKLHTHFASCRMSGEWFNLTDSQVDECISMMNFAQPSEIEDVTPIPEPKFTFEKPEVQSITIDSELEALGKVTIWALSRLQGNQLQLYLAIARRTVGYFQYTSELTSYQYLANLTGISLRTVQRTIPMLIESGHIIKVGTNQIANSGKLPYKYQLNMQIPGFPSLGNLRSSREEPIATVVEPEPIPLPTVEQCMDYAYSGSSIVYKDTVHYAKQLEYNNLKHPTPEQLAKHLLIKENT